MTLYVRRRISSQLPRVVVTGGDRVDHRPYPPQLLKGSIMIDYQKLVDIFGSEVYTSFEDVVDEIDELSEYDNRRRVEHAIEAAISELQKTVEEIMEGQAELSYERVYEALEVSSDFGHVRVIDSQTFSATDLNNDIDIHIEVTEV